MEPWKRMWGWREDGGWCQHHHWKDWWRPGRSVWWTFWQWFCENCLPWLLVETWTQQARECSRIVLSLGGLVLGLDLPLKTRADWLNRIPWRRSWGLE